ncbi:MAG: right-handed parallel beta-helix repeat-containing protein, partial [Myxococcota bacterium]
MWFLTGFATGAGAVELEIAPGEDWCAALRQAPPGGEVILLPGDHAGRCVYTGGGEEGAPVVLRGPGGAPYPRMTYPGDDGRYEGTIEVQGDHLVIAEIEFGPSDWGHAVEVVRGDDLEVRGNLIHDLGGLGVVATAESTSRIRVLHNTFLDMRNSAIYLGCHTLDGCGSADYQVIGNRFERLTAPVVGMAMHLNVDSWGAVSDNVMTGIQGPGIQVFGSRDPEKWTVIERNVLFRSETTASLWISGGPVIARNNVVIGGYTAGILAEDIEARDLQSQVHILGNTVIGDQGPAIDVVDWFEDRDLVLVGNAAWQEFGDWDPLPEPMTGVSVAGNVTCGPDCWVDADGPDLAPAASGPLRTDAATHPELTVDFCGVARTAGVAGAFVSRGPGRLDPALDAAAACATEPVVFDDPPPSDAIDPRSCGCAAGAGAGTGTGAASWWLGL